MKCADCEKKDDIIRDLTFRLNRPYDAFLMDAKDKNNCMNCVNMKSRCSYPNSDRVNCDYREGWPHWTTKCSHYDKKTSGD